MHVSSFNLISDKGATLSGIPQPAVVTDVAQQPTIFTLYTQPSTGVEYLADTQIVEQVCDKLIQLIKYPFEIHVFELKFSNSIFVDSY